MTRKIDALSPSLSEGPLRELSNAEFPSSPVTNDYLDSACQADSVCLEPPVSPTFSWEEAVESVTDETQRGSILEIVYESTSSYAFSLVDSAFRPGLSESEIFEHLRLAGDALGLPRLSHEVLEELDSLEPQRINVGSYNAHRRLLIDEISDDRGLNNSHNDAVRASAQDEYPALERRHIGHIYASDLTIPLEEYISSANQRGWGVIVSQSHEHNFSLIDREKLQKILQLPDAATLQEITSALSVSRNQRIESLRAETEKITSTLEQHTDNHLFIAHSNDPYGQLNLRNLLLAPHPQVTIVAGLNETGVPLHFNYTDGGLDATPQAWATGVVVYYQEENQTREIVDQSYEATIMREHSQSTSLTGAEVNLADRSQIDTYAHYARDLALLKLINRMISRLDNGVRAQEALDNLLNDRSMRSSMEAAGFIKSGGLEGDPGRMVDAEERSFAIVEHYDSLRAKLRAKYRESSERISTIEEFELLVVDVHAAVEIERSYRAIATPGVDVGLLYDTSNEGRLYAFSSPDKRPTHYLPYQSPEGTVTLLRLVQGNSFAAPRQAALAYQEIR